MFYLQMLLLLYRRADVSLGIRFSTLIRYSPYNQSCFPNERQSRERELKTALKANTHCYYSMKFWRNWWHLWMIPKFLLKIKGTLLCICYRLPPSFRGPLMIFSPGLRCRLENKTNWDEIHRNLNSTILVFDWHFSMKNYASRENCDSRTWWISTLSAGLRIKQARSKYVAKLLKLRNLKKICDKNPETENSRFNEC